MLTFKANLKSKTIYMKTLLTFTLAIFMVCGLYAQDGPELSQWEIGGEFGANVSWMSGQWNSNLDSQNKPIVTPVIAAAGAYNFNSLIAVTMGLAMIKSGAAFTESYEDSEYSQRKRFTALRLNPMVRLTWGNRLLVSAFAGIYLNKLLCGRYVASSSWSDEEQSGKIKFQDEPENYDGDDLYFPPEDYRRLDFGMNIGAGVRYGLGPGWMMFNVLFGMGFLDFYKWKDDQWNDISKPDGYKPYLHRNVSFTVGYTVPLGKQL